MGLLVDRKPDFQFEDSRGELIQLVHSGQEQMNILYSNAGTIRGGHCHKESEESFYVVSGMVTLEARKGNETETKMFGKGDFFTIPRNVIHAMAFPVDCILAVIYDKCIEREDGTKDIWPE